MSPRPKVKEVQVSGISALINTPVIDGYEIKEWNIRSFSRLYPYLKTVITELQRDGMTLENADEYMGDNFVALIDAFIPVLPEILEISLKLSKEEVDELPAAKASILGLAILQCNMEHITSFLAQIRESVGETATVPQTN